MKNSDLMKQLRIIIFIFVMLALTAIQASALSIDLAAVTGEWTPPDTNPPVCGAPPDPGQSPITMWGFIEDTGSCPAAPVIWDQGPTIEIPSGDPTLTINLRNCLSAPVSIFIPGQQKALTPERLATDPRRVYSFDTTAPADNGATTTPYTWSNLKAGTYLYHSGTHIQVQVQMGLYGALVVETPASPGQNKIDQEEVLLYSEIDPALHSAVDSGTYGTRVYPSTFDYQPKYFLINGLSYPDTEDITFFLNDDVRLRFLNAGLKTHIPTLQGAYMKVESEDGNLYPYKKEQYSIELTAAKTMDAVIKIGGNGNAGRYALYDRMLNLTNKGRTGGGMLIYLNAIAN
jgi:FtsP/CotA-like multicopper oxidase with cupredoxin domain